MNLRDVNVQSPGAKKPKLEPTSGKEKIIATDRVEKACQTSCDNLEGDRLVREMYDLVPEVCKEQWFTGARHIAHSCEKDLSQFSHLYLFGRT